MSTRTISDQLRAADASAGSAAWPAEARPSRRRRDGDRAAEQELARPTARSAAATSPAATPSAADRAAARLIGPAPRRRRDAAAPQDIVGRRPRAHAALGGRLHVAHHRSALDGQRGRASAAGGDDRRDLDQRGRAERPPRSAPRRRGCRRAISAISAARPDRMRSAGRPSWRAGYAGRRRPGRPARAAPRAWRTWRRSPKAAAGRPAAGAQPTKQRPRTASVPGSATPTSLLGSSLLVLRRR